MSTNTTPSTPMAFPSGLQFDDIRPSGGMTLRDYFAAKALAPCIAEFWGAQDGTDDIAKAAYQIADAMLAEREKEVTK